MDIDIMKIYIKTYIKASNLLDSRLVKRKE